MINLCDLTLHECDFSLVGHSGLACLQNLTALRIIDCVNYKRLLSFLSPNLKMLHLQLLSLHHLDTNALLSFQDLQHSRLEALSVLVVINQARCFDLEHLDLMPSLKHLNLNNVDLRDYDFNFEFFQQHLESLSLRKTRVSELDERLSKLTSLKTLDVSSNYFLKLSSNIFAGLEKLENLYMVNMSYPTKTTSKQLTIGLFKPLKNLKLLALAQNRLKHINPKVFNFLPSLEMLDLSQNQLSLNENIWISLKSLRFLDLSSNNLCADRPDGYLESIFSDLHNLEILNLSENLIRKINQETFEGLERLESLSLSNNLFDDTFSLNAFEACASLSRVGFSSMSEMSIATKTKLERFYFQKIEFLF